MIENLRAQGFVRVSLDGVVRHLDEMLLSGAHLECQRALARLREHHIRLEPCADLGAEAESVEPAGREHDGVEAALAALAQTGVDVPSKRLHGE